MYICSFQKLFNFTPSKIPICIYIQLCLSKLEKIYRKPFNLKSEYHEA